jgi:hypothetical protein
MGEGESLFYGEGALGTAGAESQALEAVATARALGAFWHDIGEKCDERNDVESVEGDKIGRAERAGGDWWT